MDQLHDAAPSLKVLFVCRSPASSGCAQAVTNQARALKQAGVDVLMYRITGRGFFAYLKHRNRLHRYIRHTAPDVVHAHYGLSGMLSFFCGARPLVVSLMGSELYLSAFSRALHRVFARWFWTATIVKSRRMHLLLGLSKAGVIPNGVDMEIFREMPVEEARQKAGFAAKRNILWVGNTTRKVKNYELARAAFRFVEDDDTRLHVIHSKTPHEMATFMNAADVLLLTSRWEGSPNVVKEALACNLPVVSTPVGDVEELIKGIPGSAVCLPEAAELAMGLRKALEMKHRSNSRAKVAHLDSRRVSEQIIEVYCRASGAGHQVSGH